MDIEKELLEEAEAILKKNKDKKIQYTIGNISIVKLDTTIGPMYNYMNDKGLLFPGIGSTRDTIIVLIAIDLKKKKERECLEEDNDSIDEEYINAFTQKMFDETTKKKGERNMRNDLTTDYGPVFLNTTENILEYKDRFKNIEFKIYNVKKYVASRERIYFIDTKGRYYYINIDRYDTEIYDTSYNKLKEEIGDYVDLLE